MAAIVVRGVGNEDPQGDGPAGVGHGICYGLTEEAPVARDPKKAEGGGLLGSLTRKFKKLMGRESEGLSFYAPSGEVKDGNVSAVLGAALEAGHDALDLSGVELSARGLAKVVELPGLRALKLAGAKVDDTAVAGLKGADTLEWLDLSRTPIDGRSFPAIGPLKALTYLNLAETKVNDAAVPYLKRHPRLAVVDLSGTQVTERAVEVLSEVPTLRTARLKDANVDVAVLASINKSEVEWDL